MLRHCENTISLLLIWIVLIEFVLNLKMEPSLPKCNTSIRDTESSDLNIQSELRNAFLKANLARSNTFAELRWMSAGPCYLYPVTMLALKFVRQVKFLSNIFKHLIPKWKVFFFLVKWIQSRVSVKTSTALRFAGYARLMMFKQQLKELWGIL